MAKRCFIRESSYKMSDLIKMKIAIPGIAGTVYYSCEQKLKLPKTTAISIEIKKIFGQEFNSITVSYIV